MVKYLHLLSFRPAVKEAQEATGGCACRGAAGWTEAVEDVSTSDELTPVGASSVTAQALRSCNSSSTAGAAEASGAGTPHEKRQWLQRCCGRITLQPGTAAEDEVLVRLGKVLGMEGTGVLCAVEQSGTTFDFYLRKSVEK